MAWTKYDTETAAKLLLDYVEPLIAEDFRRRDDHEKDVASRLEELERKTSANPAQDAE